MDMYGVILMTPVDDDFTVISPVFLKPLSHFMLMVQQHVKRKAPMCLGHFGPMKKEFCFERILNHQPIIG